MYTPDSPPRLAVPIHNHNKRHASEPGHIHPTKNKDRLAAERAEDATLDAYVRDLDRFPRLSNEQILELARKMTGAPTPELKREHRNALVEANMRLVVAACRDYLGRGVPAMDVIQEGNLGLIIAADRFDPERSLSFSNYAMWWVAKSFRRALQEKARASGVSSHVYRQRGRLMRAAGEIASATGREPTDDELMELAGISAMVLERVRNAPSGTISLDAEISVGPEGESVTLADLIAGDEPDALERIVAEEDIQTLHRHLRSLSYDQREVIAYRFGLPPAHREHSQEEIAYELGYTRKVVRKLEREAIEHLRTCYLHEAEDAGDEATANKLRALL